MKKLTIAFAIAMAFVAFGCKKKNAGGGAAEQLAKLTEFKDEMCKCKDAKCAQDVNERMNKWSQDQSKNNKEQPKMSEDDQKKSAQIGEDMGKCLTAAMSSGMAGSAEGSGMAGSAAPAEGAPAGGAPPAEGSAAGGAAPPAGSAEKK